jgi:hypothetical protein
MQRTIIVILALTSFLTVCVNAQGKKYGLKSGIVTYSTESFGMKVESKLYFDDYGSIECLETIVAEEYGDTKSEMRSRVLTRDGYNYTYDVGKKTGTKRKSSGNRSSSLYDFSGMSDKMKKEYQVKELGTEEFLGRKCSKFSMENKEEEMKGTFLTWNNLLLKSQTNSGGTDAKMIATKVEENTKIPSEKLEVPKDVVFR